MTASLQQTDNQPTQKPLGPNAGNPTLSRFQLTLLLLALAIVPSSVTVGMWYLMPGTEEGRLPVEFQIANVPGAAYYQQPAEKRDPLEDARVVITNRSDSTWDVLNIVVNKGYEIRDPETILEPGHSVDYHLDKFYNRSGFVFEPELSPVTHIRIFARIDKTHRQSVDMPLTADDYNRPLKSPRLVEMETTSKTASSPVAPTSDATNDSASSTEPSKE